MPYLVWNTPNNNYASYRCLNAGLYTFEDMENERLFLENKSKKEDWKFTNIRVVYDNPKKIGNDWYIDGEKCFEPEYARIEREYEEMMSSDEELLDNAMNNNDGWMSFNDFDYKADYGEDF